MKRMLSVWFWVGIVLLTYGIIITGSGVYYLYHPSGTVLSNLHPNLWWGGVMLLGGFIFLFIGRRVE